MIETNDKYERSKSIAILSKVSDEKHTLFEEIIRITQTLASKKLYLDIGTGPGDVFLPVTHFFERSIGLEPAKAMFELISSKLVPNNVVLQKKKMAEIL